MGKAMLSASDKALIRAYFKWCRDNKKGYPREYECSQLIENMDGDHRDLVELFLWELQLNWW